MISNPHAEDIIAAISTAWGESAIAIVRLSGEGSRDLADSFFRGGAALEQTPPRLMRRGFILDDNQQPFDEVLAVWFKKPNSYTGEESAEIHCHGGSTAARNCLDKCISLGARIAQPGEFTRRAFLNGRIDLAQAESVIGVIRARSDESLKAAVKCLGGALSQKIRDAMEMLLAISALGEAALDHPEEEIPPLTTGDLGSAVAAIAEKLGSLVSSARTGRFLREGIRVAIAGRPNVGKSSLMNAFLNESRSIVTSIPGTTRDIIEDVLTHNGIPLRLSDTAGIRTPLDEAEHEGIMRAKAAIRQADISIWVIDGSDELNEEDLSIARDIADSPHIVAVNKSDLPLVVSESRIRDILPQTEICIISATKGSGIEELKDLLVLSVAGHNSLDEELNTSERQIEDLKKSHYFLTQAYNDIQSGQELDAVLESLREARECLAGILGVSADASLLDRIFSDFCIGK